MNHRLLAMLGRRTPHLHEMYESQPGIRVDTDEELKEALRTWPCCRGTKADVCAMAAKVAVLNGGQKTEAYLHEALAKHRRHREWFDDVAEVRAMIVGLAVRVGGAVAT